MTVTEFCERCQNEAAQAAFLKARMHIASHTKIYASISGGADSDIMLDILEKARGDKHIDYIFFDTGVEYDATRRHLDYLEERYNIKIERIRSKKPIPICVKEYGQPFISKRVSEFLYRMQHKGFKFEDKTKEELLAEYPNSNSYINWWCNKDSKIYINRNPYLKEFLIAHPPKFKIAAMCCEKSKKAIARQLVRERQYNLVCMGLRKAEGGNRAIIYKTCFSNDHGIDAFRPLWWFTDDDKRYYEECFGIVHSNCYTKYGFKRTGCAGCPFNIRIFEELKAAEMYEPKFAKAAKTIFADSYEYTRQYREFRAKMKAQEKKEKSGQISLFEEEQ